MRSRLPGRAEASPTRRRSLWLWALTIEGRSTTHLPTSPSPWPTDTEVWTFGHLVLLCGQDRLTQPHPLQTFELAEGAIKGTFALSSTTKLALVGFVLQKSVFLILGRVVSASGCVG